MASPMNAVTSRTFVPKNPRISFATEKATVSVVMFGRNTDVEVDYAQLRKLSAALPEEDQKLIRLRFYAGRTQSDTARLLHTTQVQISRRERRILQQMRARLLEE